MNCKKMLSFIPLLLPFPPPICNGQTEMRKKLMEEEVHFYSRFVSFPIFA